MKQDPVPARPCLRCGRLTRRGSYCALHERERLRPKRRRQAARRKAAERAGEAIDRETVWRAGGGVCWICGLPVSLDEVQRDHVVPVSAGGGHVASNVRPAHPRCNAKRGAGSLRRD